MKHFRLIADSVATAAIVVACGFLIWNNWPRTRAASSKTIPAPKEPVEFGQAPRKGNPQAPIVVMEFTDFECPFCGRFAREVLPKFDSEFIATGKAQLVFKHLPLSRLHPNAQAAAVAAECARRQGQFWPMHDLLFANQKLLPEQFASTAKSAGLSVDAFAVCEAASETKLLVDENVREAGRLGITGTPTFLVSRLAGAGFVQVTQVLPGIRDAAELFDAVSKVHQREVP